MSLKNQQISNLSLPKELQIIENSLKELGGKIKNIIKDEECDDYYGHNFQFANLNFKYRKAKVTPKKYGLFVSLWKRNKKNNTTEPFHTDDNFDFYVIATEEKHHAGFFLFPKNLLAEKCILSNINKPGKRGFRLYPDWTTTHSYQASKTQIWQNEYFINFSSTEAELSEKINSIIKRKHPIKSNLL